MYINQRLLALVVMIFAGLAGVGLAATAVVVVLSVFQGFLNPLALVAAGVFALATAGAYWLFEVSRKRFRKDRS